MNSVDRRHQGEDELYRKIQWLMFLRIVVTSFLLGATALIQIKETQTLFNISLFPLYSLIALTYALTFCYALILKRIKNRPKGLIGFAYIQILLDVLLESCLVYVTGGVESIFSPVYSLSIIASSILLYRKGSLFTASAASILYGLLLDLEYYSVIPPFFARSALEEAAGGEVLTSILINITAFYLISMLSSYLSEKARITSIELEEKKLDFEQLSTLNQNIIESLESGLLTVGPDGRITFFNKKVEEITGYPASEIQNRPLKSLFPAIFEEKSSEEPERAKGRWMRPVIPFLRKDGKRIHIGFTMTPLLDSNGVQNGHILNFQDVTTTIEMEEHVKRVEKLAAIGEMVAGIAHEIRNPLASISGAIQLLEKEVELDPSNRKLMNIVTKEIARLNTLITDFLMFARPKESRKERVNLSSLINETLSSFRRSRDGGGGLEIHTKLPPGLYVEGAPQQLQQVFWNLLINAREAMPEGGTLEVSARLIEDPGEPPGNGRLIQVEIKDTGCGIPERILDRIFDPFFTTKDKGTGLGLSVVYRIIENMGGRISVTSSPGKGTSFRFRLPARG